MMNKQLSILFKSNNIEYIEQYGYTEINKNKIKIIIYNSETYEEIIPLLQKHSFQRKNCWITNIKNIRKHIYFNEDFIKSILRQNIINNILND